MAADLFESYEVTLVASLILGAAAFAGSEVGAIAGVMFPLFVRAVGVITSIIGILAVTPRSEEEHGMRAINRGFFISAAISAAAVFVISAIYMDDLRPAVAVLFGLILASVIQVLTQYFTDTKFKPVQEIAESTQTGPATTILSGFSIGMESTVWSVLIIAAVISGAYVLGDGTLEALYFISLTGMGMLTTVGVIVSMDTYGPVSDNAQGIAEMSGEFEGRPAQVLTGLDAIGNSTKAITKGMAIATAVIAATSLFGSFAEAVLLALGREGIEFPIRVDRPNVLVGLLIGGSVAFLFCSLAIRAVGRAASQVVVEVRNQFREHPGIMTYEEKPDYARVVDICTKTSLRELMTPGAARRPVADHRRLRARRGGARCLPRGLDPHRPAAGRDALELGRRVGQRQEVHRGRPLRGQGQRVAQGRGDRRHGRRSVQGHGRPGAQPADQGDEPGRAAVRAGDRRAGRQRGGPRRRRRDRGRGGRGRHLGLQVPQVRAHRGGARALGARGIGFPDLGSGGTASRWDSSIRSGGSSAGWRESDEQRYAEEIRTWAESVPGAVRIAEASARSRVKLAGVVRRITVRPLEGHESLEAILSDGTGEVTVMWMGRRTIRGLSLGTHLVVEGLLADQRGEKRIVNPSFEFRA